MSKDDLTQEQQYRSNLNDLGDKFDIEIHKNKDELIDFYSDSDNTNLNGDANNKLDAIIEKTYELDGTIKKEVTDTIKNLKHRNNELDKQGIDVGKLNRKLDSLKDKNDAAEPRKDTTKKIMQQDILLQVVYAAAILGGSYFIYKYFRN